MLNTSRIILPTLFILSIIFSSCGESPDDILNKYQKTYNDNNIDGTMMLLSNNAVIKINESEFLTTPEEIRNYFEYESALYSKINLSDFASSGNDVLFVMGKTSDLLETIGIDTAKFTATFSLLDGKIKRISFQPTNKTSDRINNFKKRFMNWADKEKPKELKRIMRGSNFIYTKENAREYLQIIIDWKKSKTTGLVEKK